MQHTIIALKEHIGKLYKKLNELEERIKALEEEDYDTVLYEQLKKERNAMAKELSVPSYTIFNNETLKEICRKKPQTEEELKSIKGIKDVKFEKYGERFLQLIKLSL